MRDVLDPSRLANACNVSAHVYEPKLHATLNLTPIRGVIAGRAGRYSLIHQTKVGVTIAPRAPVVGYDLLRRTKRVSRASPEDSFDVATREHGDHEVVP